MRVQATGLRTALVAGAGVAVLAVTAVLAAHQPAPPVRATTAVAAEAADSGAVGGTGGGVALPWWLVPVALLPILVVAALLWFVFREGVGGAADSGTEQEDGPRRDEHARGEAEELAAYAELALADAADELAAGADAREVVVACWVRLEAAAEASGQGRRPAETATDVARRWLTGTPDRAAVDELAALYHLARYSDHPMTDVHRERARTALRGVLGVTA